MLETCSVPQPGLLTTTDWPVEDDPTTTLPNVSKVSGDAEACGDPGAMVISRAAVPLPPLSSVTVTEKS